MPLRLRKRPMAALRRLDVGQGYAIRRRALPSAVFADAQGHVTSAEDI